MVFGQSGLEFYLSLTKKSQVPQCDERDAKPGDGDG